MRHYVLSAILLVELGIVFILGVNITIYATTRNYVTNVERAPHAQVALILGAALRRDNTPGPIYTDRTNVAMYLYKTGKVEKILVSGDNGDVTHNEVNPVHDYLVEQGVPEKDIFLDHAGFDTYSTMYRAREIFGVTSMLIATQSFHLPRALFIARRLGIEAHGVNADAGSILIQNYIREIFANEKAVFDIVTGRKPKYLGEQIPIEGDGSLYP